MQTEPAVPATEAKRRERKTFSVRLDGISGVQMSVTASRRKDGAAQTFVVHSTQDGKKRKKERGATEQHANIEVARARVDALVAQLVKAGWKVREPRGGFVRRPDAFDVAHLPGPSGATKAEVRKK